MPEECLTTGLSKIAEIAATVESTKQILLVKTYLNDEKNMSVHGKHDIC